MSELVQLSLILGGFVFAMAALGWQFTRESRRELKETILHGNEQTRAYMERGDQRLAQMLREMDAHIAMVLERTDRDTRP